MMKLQSRGPVMATRASRKAVVVRASQEPIKVGINGESGGRGRLTYARPVSHHLGLFWGRVFLFACAPNASLSARGALSAAAVARVASTFHLRAQGPGGGRRAHKHKGFSLAYARARAPLARRGRSLPPRRSGPLEEGPLSRRGKRISFVPSL